MFTLVPDENSMEDPLCNSSFGSMVSLDYVTPDTLCKYRCGKAIDLRSAGQEGTRFAGRRFVQHSDFQILVPSH